MGCRLCPYLVGKTPNVSAEVFTGELTLTGAGERLRRPAEIPPSGDIKIKMYLVWSIWRSSLCTGDPRARLAAEDSAMTSETGSDARSGQESVVLASFDSYRHAEHMLASLGHGFRAKARTGGATAVVVRGNPDGSLKVTESRVLSASDFVAVLMRVSLSWLVGFLGLFSMLKGTRSGARAVAARKGHAGSDEHRAHEILAAAGPHAALALVRCNDQETRKAVAAVAAGSATESWDGSLTEFLAALDPGPAHDWVRAEVAGHSRAHRAGRRTGGQS